MAATDPRRAPETREPGAARPRLAQVPEEHPSRPRWVPIVIAVAVLAAIAIIAYFVLYSGGGGGGTGGGGSGGGGGYAVIALSVEGIRRRVARMRRRR